jgi:hypothetical protein
MPKSVIDRLINRKTKFANVELNEESVERILHKAAADGGYDLDLSGAILEGDAPFFIADMISHFNYYKFAHVNLNKTNISLRGFDALIDTIVCFPDLKTLTVRNNNLPKEAGMSIAKILGSHATLQVLDLRENNLSDPGLAAISGAFTADLTDLLPGKNISLLTLTIIDLSYNSIGDSGLLSLCRGLSHFAKSCRNYRNNRHSHSNSNGATSVTSGGNGSALQILRLNHNKIGDKAAVCFAQFLESFYCTGAFALEEINLSNNPIGPTGLVAILAAIQPVTSESYATLMKVSLENCKPSIVVLDEVTRLLRPPSFSKSGYSPPHHLSSSRLVSSLSFSLSLSLSCRVRIIELAMNEEDALDICLSDSYLDAIVALSDAVTANDYITVLTLGDLPDVTRKQVTLLLYLSSRRLMLCHQVLLSQPGSARYYGLRVAMDCFRFLSPFLLLFSDSLSLSSPQLYAGSSKNASKSTESIALVSREWTASLCLKNATNGI